MYLSRNGNFGRNFRHSALVGFAFDSSSAAGGLGCTNELHSHTAAARTLDHHAVANPRKDHVHRTMPRADTPAFKEKLNQLAAGAEEVDFRRLKFDDSQLRRVCEGLKNNGGKAKKLHFFGCALGTKWANSLHLCSLSAC